MGWNEEHAQKTDGALHAEYPTIEPEYTRGLVLARRLLEGMKADVFKPVVEELIDGVHEQIWDRFWDRFQANLLADAETALEGHIRERVEATVRALLGGESWALEKYALTKRYDGALIRSAIAKQIPAELQAAEVQDLKKEVARLTELLYWRAR